MQKGVEILSLLYNCLFVALQQLMPDLVKQLEEIAYALQALPMKTHFLVQVP